MTRPPTPHEVHHDGRHGRAPHVRRQVTRRETFGPFTALTCDDGTVWLKGSLAGAGGFQQRRPSAPLTVDRLRDLVRAIDAAPDHLTLGKLESMIAAKYAGDLAARELLEYMTRRSRSLGDAPPKLPPTLPPAA